MNRVLVAVAMLSSFSISAACAENKGRINKASELDLGLVSIGGTPKDMNVFVSSDCGKLQPKLSDCSAKDADGRRYVFFEGALSKVSADRGEASETLRLPAGIIFGEDIESAAKKVSEAFNIRLKRGAFSGGRIVYSSDYVVRSSDGIYYSVELAADVKGRLTEVVERTDF